MIKKVKVRGWQSISPTGPHSFDDVYFHSPFGADDSIEDVTVTKTKPPATGWCSWYAFGSNINEGKIITNAKWIAQHAQKLPLKYVVIDDGYCLWGDWQSPDHKKFPNGLKFLADKIKKLHLSPGIWTAPFAADITSKLYKKHSDWFLRDASGKPVYSHNALSMPDFLFHHTYLLDYQNPKVEKYIYESLDFLLGKCGFELIKLDFLSSIYFDPRFKSSKAPDQIIRKLLKYIRKKFPSVYILTATAPIGPVLGYADSVRISADTIFPQIDRVWPLNNILHTMLLSQLEKNLEARKNLAEVIALDPDVFVYRETLGLSDRQIQKLLKIIKKTRGLRMLGDDLPNLPEDRILKYIAPLFND